MHFASHIHASQRIIADASSCLLIAYSLLTQCLLPLSMLTLVNAYSPCRCLLPLSMLTLPQCLLIAYSMLTLVDAYSPCQCAITDFLQLPYLPPPPIRQSSSTGFSITVRCTLLDGTCSAMGILSPFRRPRKVGCRSLCIKHTHRQTDANTD